MTYEDVDTLAERKGHFIKWAPNRTHGFPDVPVLHTATGDTVPECPWGTGLERIREYLEKQPDA